MPDKEEKVKVAKQYIEHKYNLQTAKNLEWNEIINRINSLAICEKEKQKIYQYHLFLKKILN